VAGTWHIGRPGSLYQLSRPPARDYPRTADRGVTVKKLLGGGAVVDRPAYAPRTFTYQWPWLDLDQPDWAALAALADGQIGPGPYTLIDGATPNFFTPNQASAGGKLRSTDGFACDASETLGVSPTFVDVSDRGIGWGLPHPATSGVLRFTAPSPRSYLAVPSETEWFCWVKIRSTVACTAAMSLSWRNAAGGLLATTTGPDTAVATTGMGRWPVHGFVPPGAVYVEPQLLVDVGSVTAPTTIYYGSGRLGMGSLEQADDETWYPGEGLPQVTVTDFQEQVPYFLRRTAQLTLQEV
jgi:hypothetical protein